MTINEREIYKSRKLINPEATLYDSYIKMNEDNLDGGAIYSLSRRKKYSHRELIRIIDDFSIALVKNGIRENSKIGALLFNSLEEAVVLLASSKIGGCVKFIDFSKNIEDVIKNIIAGNFDVIIVDETLVELVKHVPAYKGLVIVANADNFQPEAGYVLFDDFIRIEQELPFEKSAFNKNKPSVIIYSSGTTGKPKPIMHSDYTINMAANKILATDLMMDRGNLMICNIPSFIGLGLITCLYTSLVAGVAVVFIEGKMPEDCIANSVAFVKNYSLFAKEYKVPANVKVNMFTSPMFYRAIADADIEDLSFMGGMLAAGAKMGASELEMLSDVFSSRGCNLPICNGYGQNEMCGAVTLNSTLHNKNGSGGRVTEYTDVKIVDPNSYTEVDCGVEGLIIERSLSQFIGYENMENETQASKIVLDDGSEWYNTNDLGYLDKDGYIFITGRTTRVIIVHDCKISIDTIEEKIRLTDGVKECAVIVDASNEEERAIAYIVPKNDFHEADIKATLMGDNSSLSEFERPAEIIFIKDMPHLGSEKIDYMRIKELYKSR